MDPEKPKNPGLANPDCGKQLGRSLDVFVTYFIYVPINYSPQAPGKIAVCRFWEIVISNFDKNYIEIRKPCF